MTYSNAYKLDTEKLKHHIKVSNKTKLQISNQANTTDRTLRRALSGKKINLITIQSLAGVFKTQVSYLIQDDSFDLDNPPVIFERIQDVRPTMMQIFRSHGAYLDFRSSTYRNLYYHYDLRLHDKVLKNINPLIEIFKTNRNLKTTTNENPSEDGIYLENQKYFLETISKGNTHVDELAEYAYVFKGTYKYTSIKHYPYFNYTRDDEGNQIREEDGFYLAPNSKEMTLIVFSEKKCEKLILYPDIGLSTKALNKEYTKIIHDKNRKANIKVCERLLEEFNSEDFSDEDALYLEDDRGWPDSLLDPQMESYNLNLPSFNINSNKYTGEIIPIDILNNDTKKEADM